MKVKYDSDVARMIVDVEHPEFNFPEHPVPQIVTIKDSTSMQEKVDKMDINIWKKDNKLVHT